MTKDDAAYNIEASSGKIKESQGALDKELLAIEAWLDELGHDADAVNAKLREAKAHKPAIKQEPKTVMPEEDFEAQTEKLLQGSLEHLESSVDEAGEAGIDEKESKGTKKILNSLRTTKNRYRW